MFTHFIIPISDQYFDDSDIYNSVEIPVLFANRLTTSNKTYLLMKMDQPISCENLIQNLQTIIDFSDNPISTFIAFTPNFKIPEHSSVIYFYDLPEELQIFSVFKTFIKCISFYQTITSYFGNNAYKISFETKKLQLVAEFASHVPFSSSKGETEYLQMVFDEHDFPLVQITNIQKNATINDINNIINNYCKIKPKYIDLFVNPKSSVGDQVCQIIAKNKNDAEQIVKSTNQGKLGACVMTSAIFANIDEIIYEDRNYQIQQQQNKSKDEKNSQINENGERKTASKKSFQINFKQQTRNQSTTPHNNIPTTKTQPSTLVYGLERIFELHTLKHAKSYCVVTVTNDTFNKCIQFYDQSIRRNSQDTGL
ncbi:hypothetical protein TRFO_41670 [Tritrichomonas foetus]|uniref:Uncharacterized protein n=1 Tax=Tritrichomonas foetus TaxID=1144522 RepID=A0A1J4KZI8_9EUKA|nr:hypothetical protein TRFO_41670 [Tritrichomonas foetus]|eukprot:OHT16667.1 hypothetical protein TRFO_41670 [Tritrichomonas foetus]